MKVSTEGIGHQAAAGNGRAAAEEVHGGAVMNIVCAAVNAEQLYQIAETCESPFNQRAKQLADDMINEIRKRARTMSEPPKPVCQGCGKVLAPGHVVCGECASLLDSLIARKGGEQSD